MSAKKLIEISHHLASEVDQLQWVSPSHVYNPLIYAHRNHDAYLRHFGQKKGRVLMVGMNPGPWGMAQSGVPFGDVEKVSQWLGLNEPLEGPLPEQHPNYPILGMQCHRKEGSGQRLWGWAESRFGTAQRFFSKAFIWNYCPLLFIKENRNLIPEKLNKKEREALAPVCDRALAAVIDILKPRLLVGIGRYAERRITRILGKEAKVKYLLHPSPANPQANKHWDSHADALFNQQRLL